MSARVVLAACFALAAFGAPAQTLSTYTQTETGPNRLPYGLPVPEPVDSLTPVDGFRRYQSLDARLQGLALDSTDLSAHDVGRTTNARPLWAYVVGDEDGVDVEGRPEAAFFINATTHAREWAAPEVSTGTIERLLAGADDRGLFRYLLDNTRLVIIPVHNVDGLLQTQRTPTQVLIGSDPDVPNWPRDGRMRRKNMRGVDDDLLTVADHLGGIDLNRNHPPFWATSAGGGSSNNPASLTYHGTGPHGEAESQALLAAAALGPATRMRLGIDVHSFSRVFFSSNTARARLNSVQSSLITRLRAHQLQLSGADYVNVPDPANRGIGAAAEYFAYQWLVPAWTLELEPQNGPQEYGGFSVNHGGFILPASQARRVRESWAGTHAVAFYFMSGPPHLRRIRIIDAASDATVYETRWRFDPASAMRTRSTLADGPLQPGRRYRVELGFSKPMRHRDASGAIAQLPGVSSVPLTPGVALLRDGAVPTLLETAGGTWLSDPARVLRYRDDSFAFEFTAPSDVARYALQVSASDMTGLALDADPSTPADWAAGAWSEWENVAGVDGDTGGADSSASLSVDTGGQVSVLPDARVVGEGDRAMLRLLRAVAGSERIDIHRLPDADGAEGASQLVATWLPGEAGERLVAVEAAEDLVAAGDGEFDVRLQERVDGNLGATLNVPYRRLDNDRTQEATVRVRDPAQLRARWSMIAGATGQGSLVLDGASYTLSPAQQGEGPMLASIDNFVWVSGNGATVGIPTGTGPAFDVGPGGNLILDGIGFAPADGAAPPTSSLLRNRGVATLRGARVSGDWRVDGGALIQNDAVLQITRSAFSVSTEPLAALVGGTGLAAFNASSVFDSRIASVLSSGPGVDAITASTFAANASAGPLLLDAASSARTSFSHALLQGNRLASTGAALPQNCSRAGTSFGFNAEDRTACGFTAEGDRPGLSLPLSIEADGAGYLPTGVAVDGGAPAGRSDGSGCGDVDQRGAPRPQTLGAGVEARCDVGAIELGVNPYRGIWQPDRDGHGVELHTSGNQLLLVWYTYADDGQPTSYQALAPLTGARWEADLLQPRRDPQTGVVSTPRVGRVTLDFDSDVEARLGWRFDARSVGGSERIQASRFALGQPRFEVGGIWYPPSEPGYGATVTRRGETTAAVLYYYDALGSVRWVLGAGSAADAIEIEVDSFTGFCPDCSAEAMPVTSQPAGRLLLHFHTPQRLRLDSEILYPGPAGGRWDRQQATLQPLNDALDNRAASASLPAQ